MDIIEHDNITTFSRTHSNEATYRIQQTCRSTAEAIMLPASFVGEASPPNFRLRLNKPLTFLSSLECALDAVHHLFGLLEPTEGEVSTGKRKLSGHLEAVRNLVSTCLIEIEERKLEEVGDNKMHLEKRMEARREERKGSDMNNDGKRKDYTSDDLHRYGPLDSDADDDDDEDMHDEDHDDEEDDDGDEDDDDDNDNDDDDDDVGEDDDNEHAYTGLGGASEAGSAEDGHSVPSHEHAGAERRNELDIIRWHACIKHIAAVVKRAHRIMLRNHTKKHITACALETTLLIVNIIKSLLQMPLLFAVGSVDTDVPAAADIALRAFSYVSSIANVSSDSRLLEEFAEQNVVPLLPFRLPPKRMLALPAREHISFEVSSSLSRELQALQALFRLQYSRCAITNDRCILHTSDGLTIAPWTGSGSQTPDQFDKLSIPFRGLEAGDLLKVPTLRCIPGNVCMYSSMQLRRERSVDASAATLAILVSTEDGSEVAPVLCDAATLTHKHIVSLLSDSASPHILYSLSINAHNAAEWLVTKWELMEEVGGTVVAKVVGSERVISTAHVPAFNNMSALLSSESDIDNLYRYLAALLPPMYVKNAQLYILTMSDVGCAVDIDSLYQSELANTITTPSRWALVDLAGKPVDHLSVMNHNEILLHSSWTFFRQLLSMRLHDGTGNTNSLWDTVLAGSREKSEGSAVSSDNAPLRVLRAEHLSQEHPTVTCDQCGCRPLRGPRLKCLDLPDYDLCIDCYSDVKRASQRKSTKDTTSMQFSLITKRAVLILPKRKEESTINALGMSATRGVPCWFAERLLLPAALCTEGVTTVVSVSGAGNTVESWDLAVHVDNACVQDTFRSKYSAMLFELSLAVSKLLHEVKHSACLIDRDAIEGGAELLPVFRASADAENKQIDPIGFEKRRLRSCNHSVNTNDPLRVGQAPVGDGVYVCMLESSPIYTDATLSRVSGRLPSGSCVCVTARRGYWLYASLERQNFYNQRLEEMMLPARPSGIEALRNRRMPYERDDSSSEPSEGMSSDLDALFSLVRGLQPGGEGGMEPPMASIISRSVDGRNAVAVLPRLARDSEPRTQSFLTADAMLQTLASRLRPSDNGVFGSSGATSKRKGIWLRLQPSVGDLLQVADFRVTTVAERAAVRLVDFDSSRRVYAVSPLRRLMFLSDHLTKLGTDIVSKVFAHPPSTGLECFGDQSVLQGSQVLGYEKLFETPDTNALIDTIAASLLAQLQLGVDPSTCVDLFALSVALSRSEHSRHHDLVPLILSTSYMLLNDSNPPGPLLRITSVNWNACAPNPWLSTCLQLIKSHFSAIRSSTPTEASALWRSEVPDNSDRIIQPSDADSKDDEDPNTALIKERSTVSECTSFKAAATTSLFWARLGGPPSGSLLPWLSEVLTELVQKQRVTSPKVPKLERLRGILELEPELSIRCMIHGGPAVVLQCWKLQMEREAASRISFLQTMNGMLGDREVRETLDCLIALGIAEGTWSHHIIADLLTRIMDEGSYSSLCDILENAILTSLSVVVAVSSGAPRKVLIRTLGITSSNAPLVCTLLDKFLHVADAVPRSILKKLMGLAANASTWLSTSNFSAVFDVAVSAQKLRSAAANVADLAMATSVSLFSAICTACSAETPVKLHYTINGKELPFIFTIAAHREVNRYYQSLLCGGLHEIPEAVRLWQDFKVATARVYGAVPIFTPALNHVADICMFNFIWLSGNQGLLTGTSHDPHLRQAWMSALAFARKMLQWARAASVVCTHLSSALDTSNAALASGGSGLSQIAREDASLFSIITQLTDASAPSPEAIDVSISNFAKLLPALGELEGDMTLLDGLQPPKEAGVDVDEFYTKAGRLLLSKVIALQARHIALHSSAHSVATPEEVSHMLIPRLSHAVAAHADRMNIDRAVALHRLVHQLLSAVHEFDTQVDADAAMKLLISAIRMCAAFEHSPDLDESLHVVASRLLPVDRLVDAMSRHSQLLIADPRIYSRFSSRLLTQVGGEDLLAAIARACIADLDDPGNAPTEESTTLHSFCLLNDVIHEDMCATLTALNLLRNIAMTLRDVPVADHTGDFRFAAALGCVLICVVVSKSNDALRRRSLGIATYVATVLAEIPHVFARARDLRVTEVCNAVLKPLAIPSVVDVLVALSRRVAYEQAASAESLHPLLAIRLVNLLMYVQELPTDQMREMSEELLVTAAKLQLPSPRGGSLLFPSPEQVSLRPPSLSCRLVASENTAKVAFVAHNQSRSTTYQIAVCVSKMHGAEWHRVVAWPKSTSSISVDAQFSICEWHAVALRRPDDSTGNAKRPRDTSETASEDRDKPRKARRVSSADHGLHDSGVYVPNNNLASPPFADRSAGSDSFGLLVSHPLVVSSELAEASTFQSQLGIPGPQRRRLTSTRMSDSTFLELISNALRGIDMSKYDKSSHVNGIAAQLARSAAAIDVAVDGGAINFAAEPGTRNSVDQGETAWYSLLDVPSISQALPIARALACVGINVKIVSASSLTFLQKNTAALLSRKITVDPLVWQNECLALLQQWMLLGYAADVLSCCSSSHFAVSPRCASPMLPVGVALLLGGNTGAVRPGKFVIIPAGTGIANSKLIDAESFGRVHAIVLREQAMAAEYFCQCVHQLETNGHHALADSLSSFAKFVAPEQGGHTGSMYVLDKLDTSIHTEDAVQSPSGAATAMPWAEVELLDPTQPDCVGTTILLPAALCVLPFTKSDSLRRLRGAYPLHMLDEWAKQMINLSLNDHAARLMLLPMVKAGVLACLWHSSAKHTVSPKVKLLTDALQRLAQRAGIDEGDTLGCGDWLMAECQHLTKARNEPAVSNEIADADAASVAIPSNVDATKLFNTVIHQTQQRVAVDGSLRSDSFVFAGFQNREDDPRRAETHLIETIGVSQPAQEGSSERIALVARNFGHPVAVASGGPSASKTLAKSIANQWDAVCSAASRYEDVERNASRTIALDAGVAGKRKHVAGRASEDVLVLADARVPLDSSWYNATTGATCYYFELHIEHAERSTRDPPCVSVGLWSATQLTAPGASFTFGAEWGPGSYAFCGQDGCKSSWSTHGILPGSATQDDAAEIVLAPGAQVDVLDLTGSVTWRPAIINSVNFSGDGDSPSTINVHFMGWECKWDETIPLQRPPGEDNNIKCCRIVDGVAQPYYLDVNTSIERLRIAPFRSKSPSNHVGPYGWMLKEPYGTPFGRSGDVVGCWYDVASGELMFAVNGVFQGVAFSEVFGEFYPVAASSNPNARMSFHFAQQPVCRPDRPKPSTPLSITAFQSVFAQHTARAATRKASSAEAVATTLRRLVKKMVDVSQPSGSSSRPKACDCWRRRAVAVELCEFFPGTTVAQAMLVLRITGENRELAAAYLLEHQSQMSSRVQELLQTMGANDTSYANEGLPRPCAGRSHAVVFDPVRFAASGFAAADGGMKFLEHTAAAFGATIPAAPGLTAPLVIADPTDASAALNVGSTSVEGSAVVVYRGACTFVVKARNVQQAGGVAMVLVSDTDEVGFIPDCGSEDAADIRIPIIMVGASTGEDLRRIVEGAANDGNGPPMLTIKSGIAPTDPDSADSPSTSASNAAPGVELRVKWRDWAEDILADASAQAPVQTLPTLSAYVQPNALTFTHMRNTEDGLGAVGPLTSRTSTIPTMRPTLSPGMPSLQRSASVRIPGSASATRENAVSLAGGNAIDSFRTSRRWRHSSVRASDADRRFDSRSGPSSPFMSAQTPQLAAQTSTDTAAQDAAASLEAAEQGWLASVEGALRSRRVPHSTTESIMELLRQGGENELAIARTMLDDLSVPLPPRPTSTPMMIASGGTPGIPSLSLGASAADDSVQYCGVNHLTGAPGWVRTNHRDMTAKAAREGFFAPVLKALEVVANPAVAPLDVNSIQVGHAVVLKVAKEDVARLLKWNSTATNDVHLHDIVRVGTRVTAQWSGPSGGWYEATVSGVDQALEGGRPTFSLAYDDGDQESEVPPDRIRVLKDGKSTLLSSLLETQLGISSIGNQEDLASWLIPPDQVLRATFLEDVLFLLPYMHGVVEAVDAGAQMAAVRLTIAAFQFTLQIPIRMLGLLSNAAFAGLASVHMPDGPATGKACSSMDFKELLREYLHLLWQHSRSREISLQAEQKGLLLSKPILTQLAAQLFLSSADLEECVFAVDPDLLFRYLCASMQPDIGALLQRHMAGSGIIDTIARQPDILTWLEEASLEHFEASMQLLPTLQVEDGKLSSAMASALVSGQAVVHSDLKAHDAKDKKDNKAKVSGVAYDSLPISYAVGLKRADAAASTGLLITFLAADHTPTLPPCVSVLIHSKPPILRMGNVVIESDSIIERRRHFPKGAATQAIVVEDALAPALIPSHSQVWITVEGMSKQVREALGAASHVAKPHFATVVSIPSTFCMLLLLGRVLAQRLRSSVTLSRSASSSVSGICANALRCVGKFVALQHLPTPLRSAAARVLSEIVKSLLSGNVSLSGDLSPINRILSDVHSSLLREFSALTTGNGGATSDAEPFSAVPAAAELYECAALIAECLGSPPSTDALQSSACGFDAWYAFREACRLYAAAADKHVDRLLALPAIKSVITSTFLTSWLSKSLKPLLLPSVTDDTVGDATLDFAIPAFLELARWPANASHAFAVFVEDLHRAHIRSMREAGGVTDVPVRAWATLLPSIEDGVALVAGACQASDFAEMHPTLSTYSSKAMQLRYAMIRTFSATVDTVFSTKAMLFDDSAYEADLSTPTFSSTDTLRRVISTSKDVILPTFRTRLFWDLLSRTVSADRSSRPKITINRFAAISPSSWDSTLLGQAAYHLRRVHPIVLRQEVTSPHLCFEVKLVGERVAGEGGPYKEFLTHAMSEAMGDKAPADQKPLFSLSPNAASNYGESREVRVPSYTGFSISDVHRMSLYHAMGILLGCAIRTGVRCPLLLPSMFWKLLVGDVALDGSADPCMQISTMHARLLEYADANPTFSVPADSLPALTAALTSPEIDRRTSAFASGLTAADLDELDHYLVSNTLTPLRDDDGDDSTLRLHFVTCFGADSEAPTLTFSTTLRNGETVEMWPGSAEMVVPFELRDVYADWVQRVHMESYLNVFWAMRQGVTKVIPAGALALLTWKELQLIVCGASDIDVDMLQRHTEYASGTSSASDHVRFFWQTLRDMQPAQRTLFARFVFGQDRLPATDAEWESQNMRMLIKTSLKAGGAVAPPSRPSGLLGFMGAMVSMGGRSASSAVTQAQVDRALPTADVCFANLSLPQYSSADILRERLLIAISSDSGLDADDVR